MKYVSPWLNDRVQAAYFIDMGQVWSDRSQPGYLSSGPNLASGTNTSARTLLVGTGVGLRARLTRYLIGFVDLAWGLTNQSNIEPNAQPTIRTHFGIRSDLLPDTYKSFNNDASTPIKTKKGTKKPDNSAQATPE
jgi:hypothetical protein